MNRYICIHGHFYQPPRENPWLGAIEFQDSAAPYHDWNKRITAECYAPNARSRVLDDKGHITRIVNNYSRISFNFGPTLLSWMEINSPEVYRLILEADRESMNNFSAHGSAIAQVYNHIIMPLAGTRDKHTQVAWGIKDFEHRFGRRPEGMWLPETAVDMETLDILHQHGISFTILAPHQAARVRKVGNSEWMNVDKGQIDSTMPYRVNLPSGRSINIFFYNGPISRALAFEKLLTNGEDFAKRLITGFTDSVDQRPELVNIATDGESYGHHHKFGDMALAYALDYIESKGLATITNYGEYLEMHPPFHEVAIIENTSWSCAHGIERWRDDCGCSIGTNPDWNQSWRKPLREALDKLKTKIDFLFEEDGKRLFKDPWLARQDYINTILDRSEENKNEFFAGNGLKPLNHDEKIRALKLMELQHHGMLMFTSCGWFFDELSRIEAIQILQYAGRATELANDLAKELSPSQDADNFESGFLKDLGLAESNIPKEGTGLNVFEKYVRPAKAGFRKICAHFAMGSVFNGADENSIIFEHKVITHDLTRLEAGNAKLLSGITELTSITTEESAKLYFGLLHMGDHNITCGVREFQHEEDYIEIVKQISRAFEGADFPEALRLIDGHFSPDIYSVKSLCRDEQRRILKLILGTTLDDITGVYRATYEQHLPIMLFLMDSDAKIPEALRSTADIVINEELNTAFKKDEFDFGSIKSMLEKAETLNIPLDMERLEYSFRKSLERLAERFLFEPNSVELLSRLNSAVSFAQDLPLQLNKWTIQNACYDVMESVYSELLTSADNGDEEAQLWIDLFEALCETLKVRPKSNE